jgi:IS5 family transposase
MTPVLDELGIDSSPDHTTICPWEQKFDTRELRRLLRAPAEQVGWTGFGALDASGFQRNQTSSHYRNRANYSLEKMKTTTLVDVNTLAIRNAHFTTRKSWDGHIGMQAFRRNAEDL